MTEIKQANFRISTEAADAFRMFCEEQGINQAQGFDYLLEVLALDKARSTVKSRETEIADFEQHAKALISLYLHSLDLNENAEARIREEYATQIDSQTQTIADYQAQTNELKKQLEEAVGVSEKIRTELAEAQERAEEEAKKCTEVEVDLILLKEEKEKQLADKESIINMLSEKISATEPKVKEYDSLRVRTEALERDLNEALQTIKDNAKDAEIARERAVRAAEKALEAEHRKEIGDLRSQNTELLQTISANEREANEQIRALEQEKAELREELATLKEKLNKNK